MRQILPGDLYIQFHEALYLHLANTVTKQGFNFYQIIMYTNPLVSV